MSGWFAGPGYRDQFTPAEERRMEDEQRWVEENCTCESDRIPELCDRLCPCHGDPEVIGSNRGLDST